MPKLIDIKSSMPKLSVVNKGEKVAEILLYGAIGESFFEDSVSAKQFADELKKLPSSVKEIQLRVNSPGGSVFDGMSIYEKLKAEKKNGRKITAYVDGLAASIASIIIMAADEVIVGDGSMVMVHKPMVGINGNSTDMERMISILDKVEEQMISIYAAKTGQSRLEISKALAEETWYTSEEAMNMGLADSKFKAEETLRLAASAIESCKWFKNKPKIQTQNELVREKLREFNNKAKGFLKK
jgi:ATP-dependent Clp endopeptidase proteolytic subunit ClpP